MGRKRKKGSHLPERMYDHKGTYYLVEHDGKWVNLGKKLPTALAEYHKLVQSDNTIDNMGDLIDRYMVEVSPTKRESTYKSEMAAAKFLRAAFHEIRPTDVTPQAIYQYMDFRSKTAPVRVNREIALLSHMFKKAIRWGTAKSNPCHDVERNPEQPRDRYVTDNELLTFQDVIPKWLALYLDLKLLTGLRQTDLLQLRFDAFNEDGLLVKISKTKRSTKKQLLIEWTDELRQTVEAIRGLPGKIKSLYVFSTRKASTIHS